MNYSAILLVIVAALLIMLGFNGTYNDLWTSLFGHPLYSKPGQTSDATSGLPAGFNSDPGTTPAKPTGPVGTDPIYPAPGTGPMTGIVGGLAGTNWNLLNQGGANSINWKGLFGNV